MSRPQTVSHYVLFTDPERKPAFPCQVLQGPSQTAELIVGFESFGPSGHIGKSMKS